MYCLVRITSNDYEEYLNTHKKIEYSNTPYGHESSPVLETIVQMAWRRAKDEKSFLETINGSKKELYFLKQHGQIQGIVEISFRESLCYIHDFAVLKHGEGYGTILYQETLWLVKAHGAKNIELWCPWEGGICFWRKKGLLVKHGFVLWGKV